MFSICQNLTNTSFSIISLPYRRCSNIFVVGFLSILVASCSSSDDPQIASSRNAIGSTGDYATLTWNAPTTTVSNVCLTDLSGYHVHYGNTSGHYDNTETLSVASGAISCEQMAYSSNCVEEVYVCTYTVTGLSVGTWFFAVQAYDAQGNTSGFSNETSKIISF